MVSVEGMQEGLLFFLPSGHSGYHFITCLVGNVLVKAVLEVVFATESSTGS